MDMPEFRSRPTRRAQALRSNATPAERLLWTYLSRRQLEGHKFSRQMPVGPFICDFMCREAKLVLELDGGQQEASASLDRMRSDYIEAEGYRVIRFWNNELMENVHGVLAAIVSALDAVPPPAPAASGRGDR
jgi:very-short-patch-repair endonuclease